MTAGEQGAREVGGRVGRRQGPTIQVFGFYSKPREATRGFYAEE